MATTIQISNELQDELSKRKLSDRETYEEIIWDILEDNKEINQQTKEEIEISRQAAREGRVKSLAQIKRELRL